MRALTQTPVSPGLGGPDSLESLMEVRNLANHLVKEMADRQVLRTYAAAGPRVD